MAAFVSYLALASLFFFPIDANTRKPETSDVFGDGAENYDDVVVSGGESSIDQSLVLTGTVVKYLGRRFHGHVLVKVSMIWAGIIEI
jgi:hypothetical protein